MLHFLHLLEFLVLQLKYWHSTKNISNFLPKQHPKSTTHVPKNLRNLSSRYLKDTSSKFDGGSKTCGGFSQLFLSWPSGLAGTSNYTSPPLQRNTQESTTTDPENPWNLSSRWAKDTNSNYDESFKVCGDLKPPFFLLSTHSRTRMMRTTLIKPQGSLPQEDAYVLAIKAGMSFTRTAEKPQGCIVGGEVSRSGSAD